jgi:hypothetical protein
MVALTDREQQKLRGPCSLCGTRRKLEPRRWRITVTHLGYAQEPREYIACTRCRRALRELGEIAFGDSLRGVLDFEGDIPYYQGDPRSV